MIVKRQDKPDEKTKIEKMRRRLENRGLKANCRIMPVELVPAVIKTIAATAPKIFFLTRRCLNGRNVACARSKEIASRLINEAEGETFAKTQIQRIDSSLSGGLIVQSFKVYAQIGK